MAMQLLLSATLTVFLTTPISPQDATVRRDMELLQGTWVVVSLEENGKAWPAEWVKKAQYSLVIKGNTLTWKTEGKIREARAFTIEPDKKPKAIDVADAPGRNLKPYVGIYEVKGDTMRICESDPGVARPTEFVTKCGSDLTYYVFERAKP